MCDITASSLLTLRRANARPPLTCATLNYKKGRGQNAKEFVFYAAWLHNGALNRLVEDVEIAAQGSWHAPGVALARRGACG
jgi:hypothetical protein